MREKNSIAQEQEFQEQRRPTGIFAAGMLLLLHVIIDMIVALGLVLTIFFGYRFPSFFMYTLDEGFTTFMVTLMAIHGGFSVAAMLIGIGIFLTKKWSYYTGVTFLTINMLYMIIMNLTFFSAGVSLLNVLAMALLYANRGYFLRPDVTEG